MAEFASYLNKAHQSFARPSIFDLLAQESLKSSLRPAFEFLTRTFATTYPEYFGVVFKYSDELFYSLMVLIERHYLWTHNATFSENFYSLCRRSIQRNSDGALSVHQKLASLIFLVVIPYLKCKIEKLFYRIKEKLVSEQNRKESLQTLERYLYMLFPYVDSLLEATKLAFTICYIIQLINYHSITYALLKIGLTYSIQENEQQGSFLPTSADAVTSSNVNIFGFVKQQFLSGLSFAIEHALPTSVFFLKFLEWWYSSDSSSQSMMGSVTTPPPPEELKVEMHDGIPLRSSHCPLCRQPLKNATTLSKSGYVFCYTCIYKYVKNTKQCPITGIDCELDNLVRIYF